MDFNRETTTLEEMMLQRYIDSARKYGRERNDSHISRINDNVAGVKIDEVEPGKLDYPVLTVDSSLVEEDGILTPENGFYIPQSISYVYKERVDRDDITTDVERRGSGVMIEDEVETLPVRGASRTVLITPRLEEATLEQLREALEGSSMTVTASGREVPEGLEYSSAADMLASS